MTDIDHLLNLAKNAKAHSYSPYSRFAVGCAIKTTSHQFYSGCNIENASYGLALCAESSAISHMITAGDKEIAEALIIGQDDHLCAPCGACRQRLYEFSTPDMIVHLCNSTGLVKSLKLVDLLPFAFGPKHLENIK